MQKTEISWCDMTWNPVRGCTVVSSGCAKCYARLMAARFSKPGLWGHGFAKMTERGPRWTNKVALIESKLDEPLRLKKPQRIFVNSTSDLFHPELQPADIDEVYAVMRECPWHTFQVLTKRPDYRAHVFAVLGAPRPANVWEGTSIENVDVLDRLEHLRHTPAAVRFLSLEPLLGPLPDLDLRAIHWVIVGGESGPGARAMDPAWVDEILEQCREQGVTPFVKQAGSVLARHWGMSDSKGGTLEELPEGWRVREFPS